MELQQVRAEGGLEGFPTGSSTSRPAGRLPLVQTAGDGVWRLVPIMVHVRRTGPVMELTPIVELGVAEAYAILVSALRPGRPPAARRHRERGLGARPPPVPLRVDPRPGLGRGRVDARSAGWDRPAFLRLKSRISDVGFQRPGSQPPQGRTTPEAPRSVPSSATIRNRRPGSTGTGSARRRLRQVQTRSSKVPRGFLATTVAVDLGRPDLGGPGRPGDASRRRAARRRGRRRRR